jgi:hypothetical protein
VQYAQNEDKRDLFINVAMVLACVGSHGTLNGTLWGHPRYSAAPQECQELQNGGTAA